MLPSAYVCKIEMLHNIDLKYLKNILHIFWKLVEALVKEKNFLRI